MVALVFPDEPGPWALLCPAGPRPMLNLISGRSWLNTKLRALKPSQLWGSLLPTWQGSVLEFTGHTFAPSLALGPVAHSAVSFIHRILCSMRPLDQWAPRITGLRCSRGIAGQAPSCSPHRQGELTTSTGGWPQAQSPLEPGQDVQNSRKHTYKTVVHWEQWE